MPAVLHTKPRLSIVTCTYKANEKFLRKCLQSIETQTYKNIEHIFNDSYSDPATLNIIQEYTDRNKDKYPIKFFQSEPRGVAYALNKAYPHATGEIIHFLHADDYYYTQHALEKAISYFDKNPEIHWLTGDLLVEIEGKLIKFPMTKILSLSPQKALATMNWISHENTFMKTEMLGKYGGFNEDVRSPVEYRLWLRMIRKEKVFITKDIFAVYTVHKGSASSGSARALFRGLAECVKIMYNEKILFGVGHREDTRVFKALRTISDNAKMVLKKLG